MRTILRFALPLTLSVLAIAQQRAPQPLPQPQRGQVPPGAAQRGQAGSQGQAPASPFVIRINVNLVQVDAIVTDSKGNRITDLKAEDFEIFQDGKPQAITT